MTTELMSAFNFTTNDLAFNKKIKLSPEQAAQFAKKNKKSSGLVFLFTLAFGAGAYFSLQPFILQGLSITDNLSRFIGGVVLTGLALFFFYLLFQKDEPLIESMQGKAQFISRENSSTDADGLVTHFTSYYVLIGEHEFDIEREKYQAFNQGHIYKIFKENSLLGILSIEYIGPSEN
jgi:hypothetical protein